MKKNPKLVNDPTNPRFRQYRSRRRPKSSSILTTILIAVLVVGLVAITPLEARMQESVEFTAKHTVVIDADTVAHGSMRIRLKGIAAPERGHKDYPKGQDFLRNLIAQADTVRCDLTGERTHGRRVGRCFIIDAAGTATDIQAAVVASGHARACFKFGGWRYVGEETSVSRGLPFPPYCWGFSIW